MSYKFTFRGFQSVRKLITLLVDGYCVVEGESNLGKSALVRAIKAMASNQAGTDFITDGMNSFEGTVESKGHTLRWVKDRKSTFYEVDGKQIHKPGRATIPEEVKALGIAPIRTLDRELHWPQIHSQWETPFIIGSYTDTLAAELLGASAETAKISRAIKLVNLDVTKCKTRAELLDEQNRKLVQQVDGMEVLVAGLNLCQQDVDAREKERGKAHAQVALYQGLISTYLLYLKRWKVLNPIVQASISSPPDYSRHIQLQSLHERYCRAQDLIRLAETSRTMIPAVPEGRERVSGMVALSRRLETVSRKLEALSRATVAVPVDRPDVQQTIQRYQSLKDLQRRFLQAQREMESSERVLGEINVRLRGIESERAAVDYVIRTIERCPLCSAPMRGGKFCVEEV